MTQNITMTCVVCRDCDIIKYDLHGLPTLASIARVIGIEVF